MVEERNLLLKVVFWPPDLLHRMCTHLHMYTYTRHTYTCTYIYTILTPPKQCMSQLKHLYKARLEHCLLHPFRFHNWSLRNKFKASFGLNKKEWKQTFKLHKVPALIRFFYNFDVGEQNKYILCCVILLHLWWLKEHTSYKINLNLQNHLIAGCHFLRERTTLCVPVFLL